MKQITFYRLIQFSAMGATLALAAGCSHNNSAPVTMAPPTQPVTISQGPDGGQGQLASTSQGQMYNWQDVPVNQQVPVQFARFDQGGYQIYDQAGDTIVVPFVNQNMYVMKFGRSNTGQMYFVNDGQVPTLFIPPNGYLENAAAQNARWYPFPQNYNYTAPVYMGLAPSWPAFVGMGWYPGMSYYGGYWGYHPYGFAPMIGLHFIVGGHPYYGFNSYHSYYTSHPYNRVVNRTVYNYNSARSTSAYGTRRSGTGSYRSTGSFNTRTPSGGGSTFNNRSTGSLGSSSFGSRPTTTRSTGSFGSSPSSFGSSTRRTSGSFGSGPSGTGGSFGAGRTSTFGSSSPSTSSFGSRPAGSSFGGSTRTFGSSAPSTSSFGSRPSGSSFGGGTRSFGSSHSFGGGSFGGGGRSFGGGFGRRR